MENDKILDRKLSKPHLTSLQSLVKRIWSTQVYLMQGFKN